MARLQCNLNHLRALSRDPSLIHSLPDSVFVCFRDIARNYLNGNFPLSERQKEKLRKVKPTIRLLANKRGTLATKKKVIYTLTEGEFFKSFLQPVLAKVKQICQVSDE